MTKLTDKQLLKLMEGESIDESMLDAIRAYVCLGLDYIGNSESDLSKFEEAYQGEFKDDEAFAMEQADNYFNSEEQSQWPFSCIDWERAAREIMMDYSEEDGYYSRSI